MASHDDPYAGGTYNPNDIKNEGQRAVPRIETTIMPGIKEPINVDAAYNKGYEDAISDVIRLAQRKFGPTHHFIVVLNAMKGNF